LDKVGRKGGREGGKRRREGTMHVIVAEGGREGGREGRKKISLTHIYPLLSSPDSELLTRWRRRVARAARSRPK